MVRTLPSDAGGAGSRVENHTSLILSILNEPSKQNYLCNNSYTLPDIFK